MDRSAQSGRIALPGDDNSQGKKPNDCTIGLLCGNARAWSFLPVTSLPVKAAGGKRGGRCEGSDIVET
eukprot:1685563-Pleurochrysis_carterae.AAC.1